MTVPCGEEALYVYILGKLDTDLVTDAHLKEALGAAAVAGRGDGQGVAGSSERLDGVKRREQLLSVGAVVLAIGGGGDADDEVIEIAAPCAHDDGNDDNEGRQRDGHERVVRDARHDARIVHEDKGHTEDEEQDGEQRAHDDEHGCLACRHAGMAQEHQLRHRAARRPRRQEREEVIAEDDLHGLIQRDLLVRYLDEMHESAAVKEEPE